MMSHGLLAATRGSVGPLQAKVILKHADSLLWGCNKASWRRVGGPAEL